MVEDTLTLFIGLALLFGFILTIMLLAYDGGVPYAVLKKLRCKFGWHKIHDKISKVKVHKYYCKFCKKPRKHPELKAIDGGKKIIDTKFRF